MAKLDEYVHQKIVHTGQNYDYELNEIFFEDLELRKPDFFLNVDTSSLGAAVGDIIRKSEKILKEENPDALLVLGDTNSCLAAYMAKRLHIPIYHMEAGNRCFDFNVPEEINRRVIDHIADFNLVYTEHARRHLISEGLPQQMIYLTGTPMNEVLNFYKDKIDRSSILKTLNLKAHEYFVVSVHREENVDLPDRLQTILEIFKELERIYDKPVIVSTHPRTRKRLEGLGINLDNGRTRFLKPFGFSDFVQLQQKAFCTISDSGTISEESAILNFPAITLRNSMERPEALDAGTIALTGFKTQTVLGSIEIAVREHGKKVQSNIPIDYQVPDTSRRVLRLIAGTCKLSNKWQGIEVRGNGNR